MQSQSKGSRENRTIIVDFRDEATYVQLLKDGKAFLECVMAFIFSLGFQLKHKKSCWGGRLTRHSHSVRVRLDGIPIWRIQCTACKAVFTVLPQWVLRYRKMSVDTAQKALLATHGGLSLEYCAMVCDVSPMAIYRLVCALGRTNLVGVLQRCHLPLPPYFLADEKHSHCLSQKVYLPTIGQGRVIWHLGYTENKTAAAFQDSYALFQHAALEADPDYKVRGMLTDGFESTIHSLRNLFPGATLGHCLLHAATKLPGKLSSISASLRQTLGHQFYQLFQDAHKKRGLRVFSLGQKLRRFADTVTKTAGKANGDHVRHWIQQKKAGWYSLLADPFMPTTTTFLDQAHNALDRKLFMMKGFHHPAGHQKAFLNGLALLYNLVPYQRRAKHAGHCGIEVEGGQIPTNEWFLNLQILTSGGFR